MNVPYLVLLNDFEHWNIHMRKKYTQIEQKTMIRKYQIIR